MNREIGDKFAKITREWKKLSSAFQYLEYSGSEELREEVLRQIVLLKLYLDELLKDVDENSVA